MGHARLILVDPDASQPIASEDGNLRIVANGELYDDARIRQDLQRRGHVLRTRSDSEIALHLHEDLGQECLRELRGEFALAIWDERRRILFAARDRFGAKPLFYAHVGRVTYLASEVRALLAMGVPAIWDREAAYQAMNHCLDASRTLFVGIRQVPPAHTLTATEEGVRVERYWDIPYPDRNEVDPRLTKEACIARTRELLDECVRLRMRGDAPVGCLLSGGLDSSAVLGLMSRHTDRPIETFTIGFNDQAGSPRDSYDETAIALASARRVGANAHVLRLTDRNLADNFAEAVSCGETAQLNAHGVARFLLSSEIQRHGCRAVMGGEGADELFGGYAFLNPALLSTGSKSCLISWLSSLLRLARPARPEHTRIARTSRWLARATRLLGVPTPVVEALANRLELIRGVLDPDLLAQMRGFDPYAQLYRSLGLDARPRRWEPAKRITYLWLRTLFANYHMAADRLDMAHAVEVRLPFLDHVLFEFASQIPSALLSSGGRNKFVLREAALPFISENVYHGVKKPFLAPPAVTIRGNPLHDMVQDILRARVPAFVSRPGVIRLLDGLPDVEGTALSAIETLLMALASMSVIDQSYAMSNVVHPTAACP